ncbi:MAG: PAS domain S-box protein [Candidatus Helarchaeota archaeon]
MSEKQYRAIFNSMTEAIHIVDKEHRIVFYNPALKQLARIFSEEVNPIGKPLKEAFPFLKENVHEEIKHVFKSKKPLITISENLISNKKFYTEVRRIPIIINDEVVQVITIIKDITRQKKTELKLKESEELYKTLLKTSPDAITVTDLNGIVIESSKKSRELFAFKSNEKDIGYSAFDFFLPEEIPIAMENLKKTLEEGYLGPLEYNLKRADGKTFVCEMNVSLIKDAFNKPKAFIASMRDITERKNQEKKLRESEEKFRKAFNRSEFYKDLFAHDINNILQNILTSTELLTLFINKPDKFEETKNLLKIIQEQVKRGANLVLNVQKLSTIDKGKVSLYDIELLNLLKKSMKNAIEGNKDKKINIYLKTFKDVIFVKANDLMLEIFDNLLSNSIKYNNNSPIEIWIQISREVQNKKNFVKIEFIDNGQGIEDSRKEIIFQRGDDNKDSVRGMGLGLSLVRKIVNNYKGKIWAENRVEEDYKKGTKIVILIPEVE